MITPGRMFALQAALPRLVKDSQREIAEDIAATARAYVPVDSGDLQSTIRVEEGIDGSLEVRAGGGGVDYARDVEYGTSRMAAQPFMTPAARSVNLKQDLLAKIKDVG